MKSCCLLLIVVVSVALLVGCAESKVHKSYHDEIRSWSYPQRFCIVWKDWALDLVDCFSLELGAGECIGATAMATEVGQVGFFFGNVMKLGFRDRTAGYYFERRREGGMSWFYYRDMTMKPIMGTPTLFDENCRPRLVQEFPIRNNKEWHWMDCGLEVGAIFGGASAHVSPKQALDFLVSTAALPFNIVVRPALVMGPGTYVPDIDLCDDDTAAVLRKKYGLKLIEQPPGLPPIEWLNERMDTGNL